MNPLQLTLCDLNPDICQILKTQFQNLPAVQIKNGDLLKLKQDAIVSPANSFGDMGGGIDKAIDTFYKEQAQPAVQQAIADRYFGEMPVGTAMMLDMDQKRNRFLIVAPTMRIPGILSKDSINPYLAMRAVLVAVRQFNQKHSHAIQKLAIPALGTGVGGMAYEDAAEQMYMAYRLIMEDTWQHIRHPAMAPYVMRG
jgi:O-acetyl-ADP-ribose deacetylase (regulator of RNase III)